MIHNLQKLYEAADYLQDSQKIHIINVIKEQYRDNIMVVPVIGQFAAGKSKLINTLLEKQFLPMKTRETTAVPTYIRFGQEECVVVEWKTGEKDTWDFAKLMELNQVDAAEIMQKVASLQVQINHLLLKDGLVLIDTPGLNTLLKHHEEITTTLFAEAQAIIYVVGNSISNTDVTLIRQLKNAGIFVIVVRTKMDDVKIEEETYQQAEEKDRELLKREDVEQYFAISNELHFLTKVEWKDRIQKLRDYLTRTFRIPKDDKILENWHKKRIEKLTEELLAQLKYKAQGLETLTTQSQAELQRKKSVAEQQIDIVKSNKALIARQVENKRSSFDYELTREMTKICDNNKQNFYSTLSKALPDKDNDGDDYQQLTNKLANENFSLVAKEFNNFMEIKLKENIDSTAKIFNEELEKIQQKLQHVFIIPPSLNNTVDYDEEALLTNQLVGLDGLQHEVEQIMKDIERNKRQLADYGIQQSEIKALLNSVTEERRNLSAQQRLEQYVPRYIEIPGDSSASETMRKIGNVVDWATVILPQTSIMKGKKLANAIEKAAKVARISMKAKKAEKIAKVIKTTIHVAGKVPQGRDVIQNTPLNETGMLDYLTLEYWFAKAGEQFDKLPRRELDMEYQKEWEERKRQIDQECRKIAAAETEKLKQHGLIKSKMEEYIKINELYESRLQERERELLRKEQEIREQARKTANRKYCEAVGAQYEEKLKEYQSYIMQHTRKMLDDQSQATVVSLTIDLEKQLQALLREVEEVLAERENSTDTVKIEINRIQGIIKELESIA